MLSLKSEKLQSFQEYAQWITRRGAVVILLVFCAFLGASLLFTSYLSSAIISVITTFATESAHEVQKKVQTVFHKYTPVFQELLLSLQNNPENLEGKVAAACVLPEIEDVHYYLIDPAGVIYHTNYPEDLGLDLSAFPKFWKALEAELAQKPVVVHPFAFETRTGRIRMYLYTRMQSGDILELGVTLRQDLLDPLFGNVLHLQKLPFVEHVGLYSAQLLPIAPIFSPLPENLKMRIATFPNKERFGFVHQTMVWRIQVPLLGNVATTLFTIAQFNFLSLHVFSGVLLTCGLLFLLYITKQHSACFARIVSDLETLSTMHQPFFEREFAFLETQCIAKALLASYKEIEEVFTVFAHKLALVAEGYDVKTSKHMQRVAKIAELIARELGITNPDIPHYAGLHDIGKIFIPREILKKEEPSLKTSGKP